MEVGKELGWRVRLDRKAAGLTTRGRDMVGVCGLSKRGRRSSVIAGGLADRTAT